MARRISTGPLVRDNLIFHYRGAHNSILDQTTHLGAPTEDPNSPKQVQTMEVTTAPTMSLATLLSLPTKDQSSHQETQDEGQDLWT